MFEMAVTGRLFLVAFIVASMSSVLFASTFENENMQSLMKLLSVPQKPERFLPENYVKFPQLNSLSVTKYNWQTCGPSSDPIKADVVLSPDPLPIPGNITVSGSANLTVDVVSPVKLDLSVEKKVLVWIPIPCIDGVGSCSYDDACVLLTQSFPDPECPPPFSTYGLPCHCPIKAGNYNLPASPFDVEVAGIPTWLTSGDYRATAKLSDSTGKQLACYDVNISLK